MTDPTQSQLVILETFVLRARRVAAHSLAQDPKALHALAERRVTFRSEGGKVYVVEHFPPEEQVESAAARVRPLILQSDTTYWAKVLAALGFFVREHEGYSQAVKQLRAAWRGITDDESNAGIWMATTNALGETSETVSNIRLAYAYLYGDVIHHDPIRLAGVDGFDLEDRFQEAATLVARIVARTLATLRLTRKAVDEGLIPLPPGVFEEPVAITKLEFKHETEAWLAPAGSVTMDPSADPAGWTRLTPEMMDRPAPSPLDVPAGPNPTAPGEQ